MSGQWQHRPAIPLLARYSVLPVMIGAHDTTIAHSELTVFTMQEEVLQLHLPRVVIMDSTTAHNTAKHIRDRDSPSESALIRGLLSNIGKATVSRHKFHCDKWSHEHPAQLVHLSSVLPQRYHALISDLHDRARIFIDLCHTWTGPQLTGSTLPASSPVCPNNLAESLEHNLPISFSVDQPHGTTS